MDPPQFQFTVHAVTRKSAKVAALLSGVGEGEWDPRYAGYFDCFNKGLFYEAHDVLEDLWLLGGKTSPNYAFHKGLIQLAGAFVHLTKNRLRPAVALFKLAEGNLRLYPAHHDGVSVASILALASEWRNEIESAALAVNPLGSKPSPRVAVPGAIGAQPDIRISLG